MTCPETYQHNYYPRRSGKDPDLSGRRIERKYTEKESSLSKVTMPCLICKKKKIHKLNFKKWFTIYNIGNALSIKFL